MTKALAAMIMIVCLVMICIIKDIDHGVVYTGLALISGLGGYVLATKHPSPK